MLKKIYFINNDSIEILNGDVKQIITAPVDDEYSTNPGQDYDTVNFNKQGNVTKIITGFHGSIFRNYYTTKYSSNGKKVETIGYYRPKDVISHHPGIPSPPIPKLIDTSWKYNLTYKYNVHGYITQYVLKENENQTDSSVYKYDLRGNVTETDYYFNPTLLMDVTKYKYDENDNLIELEMFHRNQLRVKLRYKFNKFDINNNWIDETVHSDNFWANHEVRTFKMHRKITYY